MKCSICGKDIKNPRSKKHINSKYHQAALKKQGIQKSLSISTSKPVKETTRPVEPIKVDNFNTRLINLEKKVESIENKIISLIAPTKKIKIKVFKDQLFKEYSHLNPSNDISGVDFEIIRRRVCRELQISLDYFEDLIYDLQKNENIISIQRGREKKYIQIRKA